MARSLNKKRNKTFKCYDCGMKFRSSSLLYSHIGETHKDIIPDNVTIKQYAFNRRNNKTKGRCVICGKETKWNENAGKYERYCGRRCKEEAGRRAKENMQKKYGKDHLLDDPEMQKKMLSGRSISGEYTFIDGGKVGYVGSYEEDFLKQCDVTFNFKSTEITSPSIHIFEYNYDGKQRFYIPDFYFHDMNLIIEIKDGGDNPNNHPKIKEVDKEKERLKDLAIIKSNRFNYIKVVNKDYVQFMNILMELRGLNIEEISKKESIIYIPR